MWPPCEGTFWDLYCKVSFGVIAWAQKRRTRSKLVCQTKCPHVLASGAGLFALFGIVGIGEEWRWGVELNRRKGVRTQKVERIVTGKTQGWDARDGSQTFGSPVWCRGEMDDFNLYKWLGLLAF